MGYGWKWLWPIGCGTYNQTNRPEKIVAGGVVAIAAGGSDSLFLMSDGSLWGIGRNQYGELGDGTYNSTNRPEQIVTNGVTTIAIGGSDYTHSLFVKHDGSLWVMGYNSDGQLGDGTYTTTNRPKQIVVNPNHNQISVLTRAGGSVYISYFGDGGAKYALDRSFSLSAPNWIPQVTNPANSYGALVFTNTPNPTTNNFWRVRSVP